MRFPKRLQGLILGVTALVVGPIVAVVLTSSPAPARQAWPVSLAPAADSFVQLADAQAHLNLGQLRPRAPLPPPTPVPAPTSPPTTKPHLQPAAVPPPPAVSGDVESIIRSAAAQWGVSGDWMVSIARCESGMRPTAYNPHGPYYGLFQFLMSTFKNNGGSNIWDAADQSNVAAKMLAHGQAHQWSCA
ncbi:MAG: transglycosylase SLT domain-containing protein [Acidimicrobiia bacterium]|nr:transglycosylase SLT domain-containing protein [Acidimicrobiia bacterium]